MGISDLDIVQLYREFLKLAQGSQFPELLALRTVSKVKSGELTLEEAKYYITSVIPRTIDREVRSISTVIDDDTSYEKYLLLPVEDKLLLSLIISDYNVIESLVEHLPVKDVERIVEIFYNIAEVSDSKIDLSKILVKFSSHIIQFLKEYSGLGGECMRKLIYVRGSKKSKLNEEEALEMLVSQIVENYSPVQIAKIIKLLIDEVGGNDENF